MSLNMLKYYKTLVVAVIAANLAVVAVPVKVIAEAGIAVSPAIVTVTLNKTDETQVAYIGVKNYYTTDVTLSAELKGVDPDTASLAPTKEPDANLAKQVNITPAVFTLPPQGSINIQISVTNSDTLSPGGSYAALLIKPTGDMADDVGLQPAISANLFIVKEQGARRQLDVVQVGLSRLLWELPTRANITFANTGNVINVPRGLITISDHSQNVIYKKGIINEGSLSIWPSKQITLDVPLQTLSKKWLPGRRTVLLQYRSEDATTINSYSVNILYIPTLYGLVPLGLALGTWLFLRYRRRPIRQTLSAPTRPAVTAPLGSNHKTVKKIIVTDDNE